MRPASADAFDVRDLRLHPLGNRERGAVRDAEGGFRADGQALGRVKRNDAFDTPGLRGLREVQGLEFAPAGA